jgi:hypothetical protein
MKLMTGLMAVATCLFLQACEAPAPVRIVSDDGDYKGSSTRAQALRRDCPHPRPLRIAVRAGTLFYHWDSSDIQVSLLNNGTLSGSLGPVQITGTHDGTTIVGDATDGQCMLHFTLQKVS